MLNKTVVWQILLYQHTWMSAKSRTFADMKKIFKIFSILLSSCVLNACQDDLPKPDVPNQAERTVVLYMMAENSLNRFSTSDLNEIEQVYKKIPKNTNLIVYVDDSSLPRIYNVTAKKGFTEWKTYEEDHISTDSTVMQNILKEITTKFPAKNYGYIFWSHGSGWIPQSRSIGIDNGKNTSSNSGLQMNIPTLRGILETLPHSEFILFDACAMQSVEVAYELRKVTDYIIGSPTEIHAEGAPYDKILEPMMKGNLTDVAQQYYSTYQYGAGVILSLIDCHQMEQLAQKTAQILPKFQEAIQENGTDDIQIYMPFTSESAWSPEPFDIEGAMYHTLDPADFAEWKKSLDQAILYKNATSSWASVYSGYEHCHLMDDTNYAAVSMFIPNAKYEEQKWNEKFHSLQWYEAAGWKQLGW